MPCIDIPDDVQEGHAFRNLGQANDPSTWQGPQKTITDPHDIYRHIIQHNTHQINQAVSTPFGSGILTNALGPYATKPLANSMLSGEDIPSDILEHALPETVHLLKHLQSHKDLPPIEIDITGKQFHDTYKQVKEQTASSSSGCPIGHTTRQ